MGGRGVGGEGGRSIARAAEIKNFHAKPRRRKVKTRKQFPSFGAQRHPESTAPSARKKDTQYSRLVFAPSRLRVNQDGINIELALQGWRFAARPPSPPASPPAPLPPEGGRGRCDSLIAKTTDNESERARMTSSAANPLLGCRKCSQRLRRNAPGAKVCRRSPQLSRVIRKWARCVFIFRIKFATLQIRGK